MKKLMTVMLGLGMILGTTSLFAQETAPTKMEKKAKKHHKKAKKDKTAPPADATK